MEQRLKFNKWKHIYTLDGKAITGVTTILGVINKPALVKWGAGMASDYIRDIWLVLEDKEFAMDSEQIFKDAKTAYARKRDKAADVGSKTHSWIEQWIKGENPKEDKDISHMTSKFIEWVKENEVEFLSSEERVFSEKHFFAGTYDFMCKIDGKVYLGDLKTSSGIYNEMFFQTAAYQLAHEEMGGENVDGNLIVNCKKDGKFDWMASTEYEQNKQAFLGALAIYKRLNELKK